MLRDLIVNAQDAAIAGYTVTTAAATGMGVVITDEDEKTVGLPEAETAVDVFVLQKARVSEGLNCARTDFSDYDPDFNTFAADEQVVLHKYDIGERFAVDAFAAALTDSDKGKKVAVGTDGKWKVATGASKYVFYGMMNDNGHTLAKIKVVEDTTANS